MNAALNVAAYDAIAIEQWRANMYFPELMELRPLPRKYKSNWRILHVDGFETKKIFWFKYEGINQ